jgi:hypothetical protein
MAQMGHSDDSHSPDECTSMVVRRIRPAALILADKTGELARLVETEKCHSSVRCIPLNQ